MVCLYSDSVLIPTTSTFERSQCPIPLILLVSPGIIREYYEILSRFKFRQALKPLLELIDARFQMEEIEVKNRQRVVPEDPEDDKFIHCALEGNADALISGDEHILRLKAFYTEEFPIRNAREFLKEIWPTLSQ